VLLLLLLLLLHLITVHVIAVYAHLQRLLACAAIATLNKAVLTLAISASITILYICAVSQQVW
jgi:hypothetical protein